MFNRFPLCGELSESEQSAWSFRVVFGVVSSGIWSAAVLTVLSHDGHNSVSEALGLEGFSLEDDGSVGCMDVVMPSEQWCMAIWLLGARLALSGNCGSATAASSSRYSK